MTILSGLLSLVVASGLGTSVPEPPVDIMVAEASVAPIRVVTTLPVYAFIAREIGGSEVEVRSIAEPSQDAHFVQPRPSFARELRRADLFVTTGLDLELWVPALLDRASNSDVVPGGKGYVSAHSGIELLDVPASADRSAGDIHIYGNPHIYTDPLNIVQVARNITRGLKNIAPERADHFDAGLAAFTEEIYRRMWGSELVELLGGQTLEALTKQGNLHAFLDNQEYEGSPLSKRLGGWIAAAQPLKGQEMICYHKDWAYFEKLFQVRCIEFIEAKPGIPPTPRHVSRIIDLMRDQGIRVILTPSYYDRSRSEAVASRVGGTVVVVPMQPILNARNGDSERSYYDVVDNWISSLVQAFQATS